MLYDRARHEALTATPWSDDAAAAGIARIAEDAACRFDPDALWPTHPMDEPKDADPYCMLYFGAAGVIYALRRLSAAGAPFTPRAFEPTVAALLERNLCNPTVEQPWGSPGTLPAAIHMFEWTGERRWSDLLTRGVTILWEQMQRVPEAGP